MGSKVVAGRYELLNKIGDGGMAMVYRAKDRLLNREVAVKILKPEFTKDEKFIENFRKESHAAAGLSNANIVSIYDVGREGNVNYIVMELVEGKPLSQIISEEAPMDYKKVIDLSRQIATGLSAAHQRGIIHRDVKPHNILVREDGVAKIADFGIAKAVSTTTIVDNTNENVMGSVHYFSPEQARGGYVDEKSDIYSLGIVMYEMLTGQVPFDGDNPVSIALMHINDEIKPPSVLVEGIPPNLEKIIMTATNKYQTNRYDSAEDVIEALDAVDLVNRVVDPDYDEKKREAEAYRKEVAQYREEARNAEKKKNRNRKILIAVLAIIAAAVIALAACIAAGVFDKRETVPDLRGKTYEDAKEIAEDAGFKIKQGEMVYNEKYDAGEIVSQNPEGDTLADPGTTITVNISLGAEEGTVPKLIGLSREEAEKLIEETGFQVGDVYEETSTEPAGTVIGQTPEAGQITTPGAYISLAISDGQGKEMKEVPDLTGKKESEAKKAITNAGFTVGEIGEDYSSDVKKGLVMSQTYSAGTTLEEGTAIGFTLSKGPEASSISMYIDYGEALEDDFELTVTVSDDNGTRNVVSGEHREKAQGGETLTIEGTGTGTVTVLFDGKSVLKRKVDFATGSME